MDYSAAMLGFKQFQLAYIAVKIGLPKLLARGPMRIEQIAEATGIPAHRLARLLRALVWSEVLKTHPDGGYTLDHAGSELVDDRPLGLAEDLRFHGEFLYRTYGELHDYLLTGQVPFQRAFGMGVFDRLAGDPDLARVYTAPMAEWSSEISAAIAGHLALDGTRTIMDIAGGTGRLLIDVLKVRSEASGVMLDLPYMQDQVTRTIAAEGLSSRCTFEPCDIFKSIPADADIYMLKWILHDFADGESVRILGNIAAAMSKTARLLIIERLLPEAISPDTELIEGDLNMLCLSGGAERTLEEYRALCVRAGLKLVDCTQVRPSDGFCVMTVTARP